MDFLSAIVIAVISVVTIVYGYFKYSYGYWKSKGVPYEEPLFPYGCLKGAGEQWHMYEIINRIYDNHKKIGEKVCGAFFFARPVAILMDLDLIKNVFIKDFNNFAERNMYYNEVDDPISAHLFAVDGEKWKKLRTKFTPAFSSGKMKYMFPTIVAVAEHFRDCLMEMSQRLDEVDMKDMSARFTTDVIGKCVMGIDCNSLDDPNAEFRQIGRLAAKKRRHGPIVHNLLKEFKGAGRKLHVKAIVDGVSEFFMRAVRETVDYREKNNITRNDFMDILISLKKSADKDKAITIDEMIAQAFVFFVAGFDTSSSVLTFCLYELAVNKDIQDKARNAVREAFKKYNGQITYEMVMDVPYIDQICDETLRKYPAGAYLTRESSSDYHFPGTNVTIEKGMTVVLPVHAIHYDPEYYPDPWTFDPERFEAEEKQKRHPMTFLTFGSGPRNCIGMRFGYVQFKVGLLLLLNSFEFSPGTNATVPVEIDKVSTVYSPKYDIHLKVKPLQSQ